MDAQRSAQRFVIIITHRKNMRLRLQDSSLNRYLASTLEISSIPWTHMVRLLIGHSSCLNGNNTQIGLSR